MGRRWKIMYFWSWGCLLACLAAGAQSHETRPAYLEIKELAQQRFEVLWKQPTMGEIAVRLVPHLSNQWLEVAPDVVESEAGFRIERWHGRYDPSRALSGSVVTIEGIDQTITDVLVSATLEDGRQFHDILRVDHASVAIAPSPMRHRSIPAYLRLGIDHIFTGFDHLLFVFGLVLLVTSRWKLLQTITAFTLAHSITLAAATLGWVRVPAATIEALVALSIVFLALELARSAEARVIGSPEQHDTLAVRRPWIIAFAFGLLHGFAFAGSLTEVGIPRWEIPTALVSFNVGVELGQLLFVAAVLTVLALLGRVRHVYPRWMRYVAPYAIGSLASFWFIQRLLIAAGNSH